MSVEATEETCRILCVDDEPSALEAVEAALGGGAYALDTATSGEEALHLIQAHPYAVVLVDQNMPGMKGIELLSNVIDWAPDTSRIMLTSHADLKTLSSAINIGAIHYFLAKPWRAEELRNAVELGIGRHQARMENKNLLAHLEERVQERTAQLQRAYGDLIRNEKTSAILRMAESIVDEVLDPLTVAIGRVSLVAQSSTLSAKEKVAIDHAAERIQFAMHVLGNLVDFSREREPSLRQVDLNDEVRRVLSLITPEVKRRGLRCPVDLATLPRVHADPDQLCQVVLTLCNNAMEALEPGGTLRVQTRSESRDGREGVLLVVADTGPGIPEENLEDVFRPFYTTKKQGTGFGLAVCLSIAQVHHGTLEARNDVGGGAVFEFWLPIGRPPSAEG